MIYPAPLHPGDKIAIISPATIVKPEYIDGAASFLEKQGFVPVVSQWAKGPSSGSYAATDACRLSDLRNAVHDPEVKAILCSRGGYGCVRLLHHFNENEIRENPKWLIGFSDVSALHALWHKAGVASIHGPMAKHLTLEGDDDPCSAALVRLISGEPVMDYTVEGHPYNREGTARGRLLGGNLAVLNSLAGTGFDMLDARDTEGVILFVEDISEAIYAVERMLTRLAMSGALRRARGLVIGKFTEYRNDRNHKSMEDMVNALLTRHGLDDIPVAFGFPTGHVQYNLPLVEGALTEITVSKLHAGLRTVKESGREVCEGPRPLSLKQAQEMVDSWIRNTGGGYFSELTNLALLTEETGELARVISRIYGDQVAKEGDLRKGLGEEMADVLWVLACLANQTGVDLTAEFIRSLEKKSSRDKNRFNGKKRSS